MIYSLEIDDKSAAGKSLIVFLKSLTKTSKGIKLIETIEDDELLVNMLAAKKSGRVSKNEIRKTLKNIIGM